MASAIVVGATGILGREIVKELSRTPEEWKTIYALSRSKKDEYPSHVVHKHIDLLSSADQMASDLQGVEAEYIFFAAYLQKDTEQENWEVNGDMLSNFLTSLSHAKTKRILLVTGAKQYGVHLGPPKNPLLESDPWLPSPPFPPNFYYRQQTILHDFCAAQPPSHPIHWTVTYPNDVIGFATGNFMNLATGIALYAAITRELAQTQNQPPTTTAAVTDGQAAAAAPALAFPGSETFYTRFDTFTSAALHARFCAWAVREPRAAGQAFNVVNGDAQSWADLWPRVARRFGMVVRKDQFSSKGPKNGGGGGGGDDGGGVEEGCEVRTELGGTPPLSVIAEEAGLVGARVLKGGVSEQRVSLAKWSQKRKVKEAWERLAEREGLQRDAFEKATWAFVDFVLGRDYDIVQSMSKARAAGWTGYQDTWEAFSDVFDELEEAKVLPKIR